MACPLTSFRQIAFYQRGLPCIAIYNIDSHHFFTLACFPEILQKPPDISFLNSISPSSYCTISLLLFLAQFKGCLFLLVHILSSHSLLNPLCSGSGPHYSTEMTFGKTPSEHHVANRDGNSKPSSHSASA